MNCTVLLYISECTYTYLLHFAYLTISLLFKINHSVHKLIMVSSFFIWLIHHLTLTQVKPDSVVAQQIILENGLR